jgi:hypothetical protein
MCFSLEWLEQLLVWLVIVGAVIAILRLLLPWVASQLGIPIVAQVIHIVLVAIICIVVIYFCFALISCLGGGHLPLFPHAHLT